VTTLYYLKLTDLKGKTYYKVGVTEGTVEFRYNGKTFNSSWSTPTWQFEVLFSVKTEDAFALEGVAKDRFSSKRSFKNQNQSFKAFGHKHFGFQEVFSQDVLGFEKHKRVDLVLSNLRRTQSLKSHKAEAKAVKGFKGFVLNLALATALSVS
jgi:NADH dehydrogenase/NADH:ubiquinone oxidoreductase subunit G